MELYDFTKLFQDGAVDQLAELRDAGKLPDLMHLTDPHSGWYPHETAIKFGQLDTLKWLVNESGQAVDLFRRGSRAVVCAAAFDRVDCLTYLLYESGQKPVVDPTASNWFESVVYPEAVRELIRGAVNATAN